MTNYLRKDLDWKLDKLALGIKWLITGILCILH